MLRTVQGLENTELLGTESVSEAKKKSEGKTLWLSWFPGAFSFSFISHFNFTLRLQYVTYSRHSLIPKKLTGNYMSCNF